MVCLIFVFFLAPNLYAKYGREVILNNLAKMATGILLLFIGNSILSTVTGYSPYQLYGRSTGILYGSMGPTEFMAVPIALFIYLLYHMERINLVQLGIALLGFGLALISFRRSVQMAAVTALVVFMALLFLSGDRKRVFTVSVSFVVITLIALVFTDFTDQFQERYEGRFGDQDLVHVEEGRFTDHIMVYEDIFVHNRYSLMFDYGFFNSSGNYAGGIRGDRSLHPDVAVLVHASGLLGLVLYLGMVLRAFRQSCRASGSYVDKGIWLFCLVAFIIFTFSGRIQETAYSMSVFLLLYVPLAGKSSRRYSQEEERTGGDGAEEIEDRKKILVEEI